MFYGRYFHGFITAEEAKARLLDRPVHHSFLLRFSRTRDRENGLVIDAVINNAVLEYPLVVKDSGEVEMNVGFGGNNPNDYYVEAQLYDNLDHLLARCPEFKYGLRRDK